MNQLTMDSSWTIPKKREKKNHAQNAQRHAKMNATMKHYPIYLDIQDKKCLVVGGGSVGARKARNLAKAGGQVTVVSPVFSTAFLEKTRPYNIRKKNRPYVLSDMDTTVIAIAATDNTELNRQVASDARARGILCNIADSPDDSSFILPSIVHQGDLLLTVSTSGNSPALAKKIRMDLEQQFGDEYARFLILMGRIRKKLLSHQHAPEKNAVIFRQLVNSDLLNAMAHNDAPAMEKILHEIFGNLPGNTYADLCNSSHDENNAQDSTASGLDNEQDSTALTQLYQDLIFTRNLSSEDS